MGRPGSGKGAQSKMLAEKLNCNIFSSGNRVRAIGKENSTLGRRVKEISDSGDLTPWWFASYLFEEVLFKLDDGEKIVFEGAARTEPEAHIFAEISEWLKRDFRVIYLNVSEDTIVKRLEKRSLIEGRADDRNIQNRFDKYNIQTLPALEFFRSIGKAIDIDGEPLEDVVAAEVWGKIQTND